MHVRNKQGLLLLSQILSQHHALGEVLGKKLQQAYDKKLLCMSDTVTPSLIGSSIVISNVNTIIQGQAYMQAQCCVANELQGKSTQLSLQLVNNNFLNFICDKPCTSGLQYQICGLIGKTLYFQFIKFSIHFIPV